MTKRAILVVGNESSGTKIMTRIIIESGFYGHHTHSQTLDKFIMKPHEQIPAERIVIRRSYPHDGEWENLYYVKEALKLKGFTDIQVVVIMRDWSYCVPSLTRMNHRAPKEHPDNNKEEIIRDGILHLFETLKKSGLPFIVVTYENLIANTAFCLQWLKEKLDLPVVPTTTIVDGNAKYRKNRP